jgi:hypothetical protein
MPQGRRINLLKQILLLRGVLLSRLFQAALTLLMLFFFTLAILSGLLGTPAGGRNFGIVFVWIGALLSPDETWNLVDYLWWLTFRS